MATEVYLLIALLAIGTVYLVLRIDVAAHQFLKFRGKMLVTCPETRSPAAVEVATGRAVLAAMVSRHHLELSDCSRWPARRDCGQECLKQIEADPENHRVWAIASRWYMGKNCVYCGKPIGELNRLDRPPALLDAEGKTVEWDQLPAKDLPDALAADLPVCWNCHITETFRREHPDLFVDRPWKH